MNIWIVKKALDFFVYTVLNRKHGSAVQEITKTIFINESFVRDIVLLLSIMINFNCSTMRQNQLHTFY